jgi:hypothetical protein
MLTPTVYGADRIVAIFAFHVESVRGVVLSKFMEREIKEIIRKVDELHAKLPTLDDYLL